MHAVKRFHSIYHLNLSSANITHKGAKRIFRALHKNESLVSLSLGCIDGVNRNRIGVEGVLEIAKLFEVNKTLSILDLSCNRILDEGFVLLVRALEKAEHVKSLNLSSNEITFTGLYSALSAGCQQQPHLGRGLHLPAAQLEVQVQGQDGQAQPHWLQLNSQGNA